MPITLTPNLQAVTTVGATTTNDTTFSGELFSPIVTSGWTFTNSAKLGDPTFAGAGTGTIDSAVVVGSNTITKSVGASGSFTIVGGSNTYTHGAGSAEIFGSDNTGVRIESVVFGHNNTFGASAQVNNVFGTYNTLGSSTSSNYLFGSHTLGASASSNFLFGSAVLGASVTGNIVIGAAESDYNNCTFIGSFGTGASISTSQFEFWFGTANDKYIFSGYFPDNGTLGFGTGRDATIYYDGTNLILNPDVVGTGKVSINGAYTLPSTDGTLNYVLKTDGAGSVTWQPDNSGGAATAGGLDTEIQWNNATAIDGTTGLHWLTATSDFQFDDNINATFGTGSDAKIYYDATNLLINPKVVGSGIVYIGDGATGADMKAGFLGLADSAVSSSRVIDMDCTSTTILRGLSSVITHTGTTSAMRAMLFTAIHSGSSTTGAKAPIGSLVTSTLGTDTTGNITVAGTITSATCSAALASIGSAQTVQFYNKFTVSGGTGHTTDSTIQAAAVWADEPTGFTGAVGTVNKWALRCSGDAQVNSNKWLILEGSDTVKGDTYLTYTSADSELYTYANAVKAKGVKSDRVNFYVPPTNMGISKGVTMAIARGFGV